MRADRTSRDGRDEREDKKNETEPVSRPTPRLRLVPAPGETPGPDVPELDGDRMPAEPRPRPVTVRERIEELMERAASACETIRRGAEPLPSPLLEEQSPEQIVALYRQYVETLGGLRPALNEYATELAKLTHELPSELAVRFDTLQGALDHPFWARILPVVAAATGLGTGVWAAATYAHPAMAHGLTEFVVELAKPEVGGLAHRAIEFCAHWVTCLPDTAVVAFGAALVAIGYGAARAGIGALARRYLGISGGTRQVLAEADNAQADMRAAAEEMLPVHEEIKQLIESKLEYFGKLSERAAAIVITDALQPGGGGAEQLAEFRTLLLDAPRETSELGPPLALARVGLENLQKIRVGPRWHVVDAAEEKGVVAATIEAVGTFLGDSLRCGSRAAVGALRDVELACETKDKRGANQEILRGLSSSSARALRFFVHGGERPDHLSRQIVTGVLGLVGLSGGRSAPMNLLDLASKIVAYEELQQGYHGRSLGKLVPNLLVGFFKPIALLSRDGHGGHVDTSKPLAICDIWHEIDARRGVASSIVQVGGDLLRILTKTSDSLLYKLAAKTLFDAVTRLELSLGDNATGNGRPMTWLYDKFLQSRLMIGRALSPTYRALDNSSHEGRPVSEMTLKELNDAARKELHRLVHERDPEKERERRDTLEGLAVYIGVREWMEATRQERRNLAHLRELSVLDPTLPHLWHRIRNDTLSVVSRLGSSTAESSEKMLNRMIDRFNRCRARPREKNIVLDVMGDGRILLMRDTGHLELCTPDQVRMHSARVPLAVLPHADDARLRMAEIECGMALTDRQRSQLLRAHYDVLGGVTNLDAGRARLADAGLLGLFSLPGMADRSAAMLHLLGDNVTERKRRARTS